MHDSVSALIAQMRAQRERWVDVGDGRAVCVLVLRETEIGAMRDGTVVDLVIAQAVNWRGFTGATLLGPSVGHSDAVEFDSALFGEWVRNQADVVSKLSGVLVDDAKARVQALKDARKN